MKITVEQYNAFTEAYFKTKFPLQRYGQAFHNTNHLEHGDFGCDADDLKFYAATDIGWCRHYIEHHFIDYGNP